MGVLSQLKEIAERVFLQEIVDEADLVNVFLYLRSSLHSHFQVLFCDEFNH